MSRTQELLNAAGTAFLASEDLAGDWLSAAVAVVLVGRNYDAAGFRYERGGRVVPIAPDERELYDLLIELRDEMAASTSRAPWLACLLQAVRADRSFRAEFEYDDPGRWKIGPANLASMRDTLRPQPVPSTDAEPGAVADGGA